LAPAAVSIGSRPPAATARPVTARPVTARPVTARPVTARPVTARPVTARPVTARPVTEATMTAPAPALEQQVAAEAVTALHPAQQVDQAATGPAQQVDQAATAFALAHRAYRAAGAVAPPMAQERWAVSPAVVTAGRAGLAVQEVPVGARSPAPAERPTSSAPRTADRDPRPVELRAPRAGPAARSARPR
jgi:hypothetical protein